MVLFLMKFIQIIVILIMVKNIQWEKYGKGDKIKIVLNLENVTIKFYKNDIDLGIAYENIQKSKDLKYKLAVYLHWRQDSVSIINFEQSRATK